MVQTMKIVVLDGYTLNPGDLSWSELEALGDVTVYDRTPPELLLQRAAGAEILLTNKTVLSRETLQQLPELRFIAVLATGYNVVDIEAARQLKIPVSNVPTYGTRSVAQMVFAHLLNLTQHVGEHAAGVRAGRWAESRDWCYWEFPLIELDGLTLGLVGLGRIGRAAAEIALAFGMRVIAYDVVGTTPPPGVTMVKLETLFRTSDVVSLHCPLTADNRHLVDAERLGWMKPTAMLINTSRGPLVDEVALANALRSGRLAGAGLDVIEQEPPPAGHPLVGLKNCHLTPHIAWATQRARARLLATVVRNVRGFLEGRPEHVVNEK